MKTFRLYATAAAACTLFGNCDAAETVTSFTYDALGRLITATESSGSQVAYAYDRAGNRTQVVGRRILQAQDFNFKILPGQSKTFTPLTSPTNGVHLVEVTSPTHGTSLLNGDGSITYTPTAGYVGSDAFTYSIADNTDGSGSGRVSVTVNTPPVAKPYSFLAQSGAPFAFNLFTGGTPLAWDPDGQPLTARISTPPAHGSATVSGGLITYTPAVGYGGSDTFTYTVTDPLDEQASGLVTATVNRAPVAANDYISTPHRNQVSFDPRSNDSDPDGDSLIITEVGAAARGTVTNNGGQSLTYRPTGDYVGSDSFTYKITDNRGGFSTATVTMTLTNSKPIAAPDSVIAQLSTPLSFDPRVNDSDPDGDPITIVAASNGAHGTTTFNGSSITYSPYSGSSGWDGYYGPDSFTYKIDDGHGETATTTVSVLVNRPPQANYERVQTTQNVPITYDPRTNDFDPDGDPLTIIDAGPAAHGVVTFTGSSITYTPAPGFVGIDQFNYKISDGKGGTSTGWDEVNVVGAVNHPPVANNDEYYMNYQYSPITLWILDNDYDPDGDPIYITSVTWNGGGHPTITHNGGAVQLDMVPPGTTSFSYTISDGRGGTSFAWVTVTGLIPGGGGGGGGGGIEP